MMKRILVPLDGSTTAEPAIPIAGRLARATGGSVVLLRTIPFLDDVDYEASLLYAASAELIPDAQLARQSAQHYLKGVAASSDLAGVNHEMLTTIGQAAAMIVAVASTRDIDLIVMSSHDHTDVKYHTCCNVTQTVTRHAPVPVFVLHNQASSCGPPPSVERPLRVFVPLDGSALAEAVLTPAAQLVAALADPRPAAIHLVRVVKPESVLGAARDMTKEERSLQQAQAYLTSIAEYLKKGIAAELKLAITWSTLLNNDVTQAIIRAAEEGEDKGPSCDLIALATHGRLGLQFLEMGSVAECLLAGTHLPIFIVRPENTQHLPHFAC